MNVAKNLKANLHATIYSVVLVEIPFFKTILQTQMLH